MSIKKHYREVLDAVNKLLEPLEGRAEIKSMPRGHDRLIVHLFGKAHEMPIACTPRSKNFAVVHKVNDVKRLIRSYQ